MILIKSAALALFLLGCSLTGQLHSLLLTSLLIGMAATMALTPDGMVFPGITAPVSWGHVQDYTASENYGNVALLFTLTPFYANLRMMGYDERAAWTSGVRINIVRMNAASALGLSWLRSG